MHSASVGARCTQHVAHTPVQDGTTTPAEQSLGQGVYSTTRTSESMPRVCTRRSTHRCHVDMCAYNSICICTYLHGHICTRTQVCTPIHMFVHVMLLATCVCARVHTCLHTHTRVYTCCKLVYTHVHIGTHTCVHTHVHVYTCYAHRHKIDDF